MAEQFKVNDIRHPDVLKFIGKCVSTGMPWTKIAREIEVQFGKKTSPPYVKSIFNTYVQKRDEVLRGDHELQEDIKQEILNWKTQITNINQKAWEFMNDPDLKATDRLRAMAEVRKQLELQNKILERMENTLQKQDFNKLEMTRMLFGQLQQLEKDGMIKILRMPGQGITVANVIQKEEVQETIIDNNPTTEVEENEH